MPSLRSMDFDRREEVSPRSTSYGEEPYPSEQKIEGRKSALKSMGLGKDWTVHCGRFTLKVWPIRFWPTGLDHVDIVPRAGGWISL